MSKFNTGTVGQPKSIIIPVPVVGQSAYRDLAKFLVKYQNEVQTADGVKQAGVEPS